MSELLIKILAVGLAYIIGSIPTAVWTGKMVHGIDVREKGSGNAGATNTFRVLGKKTGIPVLLFDILKGWAAIFLIVHLIWPSAGSQEIMGMRLFLGAGAVLGHIFPVFASFKGGKGIATLLGVVLAIHLYAALTCLGIFLLFFLLTRYVSLGSIIAAIAFPILINLVFKTDSLTLVLFSIGFPILVLITHQKNIERLLKNEENKARIGPRERSKK